jgi:hypothetical protein
MALRLKGSSSGYAEIDAAAVAGDVTLTLPSTTGTINVKDGSGTTNVGTGVNLGNPGPNIFTINTNGSERFRIDANGNVNISGLLTYEDVTSVDAIGLSTFRDGLITKDVGITTITSSDINGDTVTAVDVFVYDTSKDSDGGAWRKRTSHTSWYNETLGTATRGSRKEFPAVAVLVLESLKLTIYDGDDPDLPMWMEFINTSGNLIGGSAMTAVTALNGIIVTGSGGYTMETRFISDYSLDWFTNQLYEYKGNIEQRNDTLGFRLIESYGIVNNAANDVAMTVLPNAPIDPSTGLPIPTIAVATDGGVSVIRDDGTVVQKAVTDSVTDVAKVEFTNDGFLLVNRNDYHYFVITTIEGAESTAHPSGFTHNINYFRNDGTNFPGPLSPDGLVSGYGNQNILKTIKGTDLAVADSYGLNIFNVTRGIPSTDNMVAYITSDYNTGWMHGDIKGAFLSDTSTTFTYGSELVTNGTFASDISGWIGFNSVLTHQTDAIRVADNGSYSKAYRSFTTVVGKEYVVKVVVKTISGGAAHCNTGSQDPADVSGNDFTIITNITATGTYYNVFTANADTSYIEVWSDGVNYVEYSELSVKENAPGLLDRSVNNNGLIQYGTITKQPVAGTGVNAAELVAYSGWSASDNLVQPYNSDLNFGTGDFIFIAWIKKATLSTNHYVLDRNDGSGENDRFSFMINAAGKLNLYSGSTNAQAESAAIFAGSSAWRMVMVKRVGGVITFGLDGKEYTSTTTVGNWSTTNLTGSGNENLFIGQFGGGGAPGNVVYNVDYGIGEIANVRLSASAPSPEQFKKMYEDEKHLFQENAKATLYGSSDTVTALAYDEVTDQLHVGTSSGRSDFQGLRRINNTTQQVETAISAHDTFIIEQ